MANDDSVSRWLDGLRAGDSADIQRLWDRYFQGLVRVAGARMRGGARREYDEEDVALSAFHSLCDRVGRGQFPQLADRDDLWRLLVTITARKVISAVRHLTRWSAALDEMAGDGMPRSSFSCSEASRSASSVGCRFFSVCAPGPERQCW